MILKNQNMTEHKTLQMSKEHNKKYKWKIIKDKMLQTCYYISDTDFKRNFAFVDKLLHGVTCGIKEQSS